MANLNKIAKAFDLANKHRSEHPAFPEIARLLWEAEGDQVLPDDPMEEAEFHLARLSALLGSPALPLRKEARL